MNDFPCPTQLLSHLNHDMRLVLLGQCIEAFIERGQWMIAQEYLAHARHDADHAEDHDQACAFHTTIGGWFLHANPSIARQCFDRAAARLAGDALEPFINAYPLRFPGRGRQRELIACIHAARLCLHLNRRDLAQRLVQTMREKFGQAIGVDGSNQAFLWAMVEGGPVSPQTMASRVRVCGSCSYAEERGGTTICGLAGLKVGGTGLRWTDLTAYQERLPDWGCQHPQRSLGHGWPIHMTNQAIPAGR